MDKHRVSVLIPVYNMKDWVVGAIKSSLSQTRPPDEVLVWDDGSTDGTYDIIAREFNGNPLVKLCGWEKNQGGGAAFRQMIGAAQGDLLVPFAADDLLEPEYIESCIKELDENPNAMMVSCHPSFIDSNGAEYNDPNDPRLSIPKPVNMPRENFLQTLRQGNLYFGVGMYHASTFVKIGLFDNDLKWLSDWDYYIRVLKQGEIRIVEKPLCRYRLHPGALSLITNDKLPQQARMVRHIRNKHFAPTKQKVMLATPFYMNLCFSNYKSSVIAALDHLSKIGIAWELCDINGDSYVDRAKNTIAAKFLESDCTDLMMIDSDMSFPPDAIARILQWRELIVAGAFPMKNNWGTFVGEPLTQADGKIMGHALTDGSWLMQARRVAGGFLRIKREALMKFADHYPERIYLDPSADPNCRGRIYVDYFECARHNYIRHGEDMYFSHLCTEAGLELWIDPNITFGHYGIQRWEGNYHESMSKNMAEHQKAEEIQKEDAHKHVAEEMERLRREAAAAGRETGGKPIKVVETPLAGVTS